MKVPPYFIGAAVIFWGVESGNIVIGAGVAILLESYRFIEKKWPLTEADFVRISDFTSVIFLATLALILLNIETRYFLKTLVRWSPLINLPLILAQLYSTNEQIIIGTQLGGKKKKAHLHTPMDFTFPYCAICIISAAIANSRSELFFPAVIILLTWLLFGNRSRAFSIPLFFVLITLAAGIGFLSLRGAEKGHDYITSRIHKIIRGYYWDKYSDPFSTNLSFGSLKRFKNSGSIVIRLTTDGPTPLLLKQASYDTYFKNNWNSAASFAYLPVTSRGWQLLPEPSQAGRKATVELYLPKEKGMLPFPIGSYWLQGENLYELEQNKAGVIKILDAASLVAYDIHYRSELQRLDDTPTPKNLQIPADEDYVINHIAETLQLQSLAKKEQLLAVESFFKTHFTYSLEVKRGTQHPTSLGNFLISERRGYCEMFATATALLLRKAGTPSRYVTGFLVSEYSTFEKKYIVRQRHAHAWAEAFIDGRWVTVDTTPASWPEMDQENSSFFEPLKDFFSYLKLRYDIYRIQTEQEYNLVLSAIIILLTAILGFRFYRRMQTKKIQEKQQRTQKSFTGIETPFTRIEQRLAEVGITRGKGEPFLFWATRINDIEQIDIDRIASLYILHQRLRFDPQKAGTAINKDLERGVNKWMESFSFSQRPAIGCEIQGDKPHGKNTQ